MKVTVTRQQGLTLAQQLEATGVALDLRCGGQGTCGRCRVRLIEGALLLDGRPVAAQADVPACRARLGSGTAIVDVPAAALAPANGRIAAGWQCVPLPRTPETVIAVDIGTTTLAAVKVRQGEVLAIAGCYNPQSRFGDNVITRIMNAADGGLARMQAAVLDATRGLLETLGLEGVQRIAIAGNTVMTCLFHGVDPTPIGALPFTPPLRVFPERRDLVEGIPLLTVPCISGYVGGDLTAGLAETGLRPGEMLIDIGTNCEIILATDRETVCAAAAGPAFEGAGLSCVCRAGDGAIDHFLDDGAFTLIGDGEPAGLCGSAFIDFIATRRRAGRISTVGRYQPAAAFCSVTDKIKVHERDIEQILKAKAAVWAGIRTIEEHCGGPARKIFLAGGFAQYLDLANGRAIGMLPGRPCEIVGNTSLAGAARLACDPAHGARLAALINTPREIPLNTLPAFQDNFIDGLLLP